MFIVESLLDWKAGLTRIFSMKSLLVNKHINGQRSLEISTLLMLQWVGLVVPTKEAVPLLPSAYSRGLVCVGPAIYVL